MSASIRVTDAAFLNYIALNMPYQDGLEGWFMPRSDNNSLFKNWLASQEDMTGLVAASPTYDGESAYVSYAQRVNTGVALGLNWTMAMIVKAPYGSQALALSSNGVPGNTTAGDSLVLFNDGTDKYQCLASQESAVTVAEISKTAAGVDDSKYVFVCGTGRSDGADLYIGKNNALAAAIHAQQTTTRNTSSSPIYVGGANAGYASPFRMAFAGIWNKTLTEAEVLQLYQYLRQLFASLNGNNGVQ